MFLLLTVWYKEGEQKLKTGTPVCDCVSAKLSQLKSWQSVEAREQSEES